jgi:hypothetical protein
VCHAERQTAPKLHVPPITHQCSHPTPPHHNGLQFPAAQCQETDRRTPPTPEHRNAAHPATRTHQQPIIRQPQCSDLRSHPPRYPREGGQTL